VASCWGVDFWNRGYGRRTDGVDVERHLAAHVNENGFTKTQFVMKSKNNYSLHIRNGGSVSPSLACGGAPVGGSLCQPSRIPPLRVAPFSSWVSARAWARVVSPVACHAMHRSVAPATQPSRIPPLAHCSVWAAAACRREAGAGPVRRKIFPRSRSVGHLTRFLKNSR
jgi:hypothetical protein